MKLRKIFESIITEDEKVYTKTVPEYINTGFSNGTPSKTTVIWYKVYKFSEIESNNFVKKAALASLKHKTGYMITSDNRIFIPNKYYMINTLPMLWVYCDDKETVHLTKFKI